MEALQYRVALAEKCGDLASLVRLFFQIGLSTHASSGDVSAILTLADRALELACREGSPSSLLFAHSLQIQARRFAGDLAGVEEHFAAEMKLADAADIRRNWSTILVQDLGTAGINAWLLGQPDLARQRAAEMIATTNANNPYEVAISKTSLADLHGALREYEQSEACARQALELSEKYQFLSLAVLPKCILGKARSSLGRTTEGIELLRQGIASLPETGMRGYLGAMLLWLALPQADAGTIVEMIEIIEQALQEGPSRLLKNDLWPRKYRAIVSLAVHHSANSSDTSTFSTPC